MFTLFMGKKKQTHPIRVTDQKLVSSCDHVSFWPLRKSHQDSDGKYSTGEQNKLSNFDSFKAHGFTNIDTWVFFFSYKAYMW